MNRSHRTALLALGLLGCLLGSSAAAWAAEAKLAWDPPTTNGDGTPLTDLAGYKIYYGNLAGPPFNGTPAVKEGPSPISVPTSAFADPDKPTFTLTGIPSCTHMYYAVTAYNSAGDESDFSNRADKSAVYKPQVTLSVSAGRIALSWTGLPSDDQGSTLGYLVDFASHSGAPYDGVGAIEGSSPINVPPTTTSFTLSGLPAATYYVAVESLCLDAAKRSDEVQINLGAGDGGAQGGDGGSKRADASTKGDHSVGPSQNPGAPCPAGCGCSTSAPQSGGSAVVLLLLLLLVVGWCRSRLAR